ncbi:MAG: thioredoxin domain-containing protein, partial [Acidobacteriota bacterium]
MSESAAKNRLGDEISPYLLQHANNPVDWYPWGKEALERARREDKPILLSIGYAACHWCHVMERESFEDPRIAELMNDGYVCIKVDREERPDLDDIYMTAVQMMTGSGGWPLTVFLTPTLRPFFGGTYFPPEDRLGMPGFPRVLQAVRQSFEREREAIDRTSRDIVSHIASTTTRGAEDAVHELPGDELLPAAAAA